MKKFEQSSSDEENNDTIQAKEALKRIKLYGDYYRPLRNNGRKIVLA